MGHMTTSPGGYYSNIKALYKGLLKREVMKSELKDLETVIKKIDECMKYIDSLNN